MQVADQGLHPRFAEPLSAFIVGAHQRPHDAPAACSRSTTRAPVPPWRPVAPMTSAVS